MSDLRGILRDVARRPWYYANSAWIRSYRILSPRGLFGRTVFAKTRPDLRHYDSIVFVLDTPMTHIGDQLFFLPLIFKLAKRNYPVVVRASKSMSFLFPQNLLKRQPGVRALYVSRLPVLPAIRKAAGAAADFFVIDGLSPAIQEPIGLFTLRTFCEHFRLSDVSPSVTAKEVAELARPVALPDALNALTKRPLIVLSNYINSGKYNLSSVTVDRMLRDVAQYKKRTGGTVVHLGTAHDRDSDPTNYNGLVDVDLRGRTSISDVFSMFRHLDITFVFTFDTATLHIARIYGVPVKDYWRSRRTKERYIQIKRAHIHFFDESVFARMSEAEQLD